MRQLYAYVANKSAPIFQRNFTKSGRSWMMMRVLKYSSYILWFKELD